LWRVIRQQKAAMARAESAPTGEHRSKAHHNRGDDGRVTAAFRSPVQLRAIKRLARKNAKNRPMRAGSNSESAARAGQNNAAV